LAFTEPSGKWDEAGITMEAKGSGDGYTLSGTKMFVLDGTPRPDHRRGTHRKRRQPVRVDSSRQVGSPARP
jgi:hypothetical protein